MRKRSRRLVSGLTGLAVVAGIVIVTAEPAAADGPVNVGCGVTLNPPNPPAGFNQDGVEPEPNSDGFAWSATIQANGTIRYTVNATGNPGWARFRIIDANHNLFVHMPELDWGAPYTQADRIYGFVRVQQDGTISNTVTLPLDYSHDYFYMEMECSLPDVASGWIDTPLPPPLPTPTPPATTPPPPPPVTQHWVSTFANAPGYPSAGSGAQSGTLYAGYNYVYCRVWGPIVQVGSAYNHWWLRTDLDTGWPWQNQYVSAYYLSNWGNDVAKDDNGADIPNC